MQEENKTQNIPETEVGTKTENKFVEPASLENEDKKEIPVEVITETKQEPETIPKIEPQTEQETPTQPTTQETTPPIAETPKEEVKTTPPPQTKTIEKIVYKTDPNIITKLLNKARAKIQERKRKKLDKIMLLFNTNTQITNKDVQKLLRTTRVSSFRYLNILESENKIM